MRAAYRIQLNKDFTFDDLIQIVPYLHRLGISHLYLSPVFESAPGSNHGYDILDPVAISKERGGEDGLYRLDRFISRLSPPMKIIMDIIPNHLAANPANPYWRDVLKKGRNSSYWTMFDIRLGTEEKICLPVLQNDLDQLIESGDLELVESDEGVIIRLHDANYPVSPDTKIAKFSKEPLKTVLGQQNYQFTDSKSLESINYRRFFDVIGLIGVKVEDPDVLSITHQKIYELLDNMESLEGFRVDHIDGLLDPAAYLDQLRSKVSNIWVEKILAAGETLPGDWPVKGTTGYEFIDYLNRAFILPDGYEKIRQFWHDNVDARWNNFEDCVTDSKDQIIDDLFPAELIRLADFFRDRESACSYWRALTLTLPVYRSYLRAMSAIQEFQPIQEWQQFSGAVMAKGLEDTAHYRYIPLLSLNEVGCAPEGDALTPQDFVAWLFRRREEYPHTLNASTTHDTKRSEDCRHRLNALSAIPEQWIAFVKKAFEIKEEFKVPPKTAYLLYQAIVSTWPFDNEIDDSYRDRILQFMEKATREAKQETSWLHPDQAYDDSIQAFTRGILTNLLFADHVRSFVKKIGPQGAILSLSGLTLKILSAGVPDFYQGTEIWRFYLVDPDNRRSVDYEELQKILDHVEALENEGREACLKHLCQSWIDGSVKLWLTKFLIGIRGNFFPEGNSFYHVIETGGVRHRQILSYKIDSGHNDGLIITVPLNLPDFKAAGGLAFDDDYWGDTVCCLPEKTSCYDLIGERIIGNGGKIKISEIFRDFPVSVLRYTPL